MIWSIFLEFAFGDMVFIFCVLALFDPSWYSMPKFWKHDAPGFARYLRWPSAGALLHHRRTWRHNTEIVLLADGWCLFVCFRHVVGSAACFRCRQSAYVIKRACYIAPKASGAPHHVMGADRRKPTICQKYNIRNNTGWELGVGCWRGDGVGVYEGVGGLVDMR